MSKKFSGKLIGAAAGFCMTGSIMGGIIGGILGSMFDKKQDISTDDSDRQGYSGYRRAKPQVREFVFVSNLVALMTSVAKADKEIHAEEVRAIRNFCNKTFHYTGHDGKVIDNLIRECAGGKLDVRAISGETRRMLEYPELLMIVRILYIIALSDNVFKEVEKNRIQQIVDYLGVSQPDHDYIMNEFSVTVSKDVYAVLKISPEASDSEVKEAYREMVKKYHPDKVSHLGSDFVKLSKEKFQKIQDSYQKISKERGL